MNGPSLKIFSLLFGLVYLVVFYMEWAIFRYYPETQTFYLKNHPDNGPAILWYGWLAAAAIVSAAAALVVPRRLAERIPNEWIWEISLVLIVAMFIYEKQWFF